MKVTSLRRFRKPLVSRQSATSWTDHVTNHPVGSHYWLLRSSIQMHDSRTHFPCLLLAIIMNILLPTTILSMHIINRSITSLTSVSTAWQSTRFRWPKVAAGDQWTVRRYLTPWPLNQKRIVHKVLVESARDKWVKSLPTIWMGKRIRLQETMNESVTESIRSDVTPFVSIMTGSLSLDPVNVGKSHPREVWMHWRRSFSENRSWKRRRRRNGWHTMIVVPQKKYDAATTTAGRDSMPSTSSSSHTESMLFTIP